MALGPGILPGRRVLRTSAMLPETLHERTAGLCAGVEQRFGPLELGELARVDNLFDEMYIRAVKVDDSNRRYQAPAAGVSYLVSIPARPRF